MRMAAHGGVCQCGSRTHDRRSRHGTRLGGSTRVDAVHHMPDACGTPASSPIERTGPPAAHGCTRDAQGCARFRRNTWRRARPATARGVSEAVVPLCPEVRPCPCAASMCRARCARRCPFMTVSVWPSAPSVPTMSNPWCESRASQHANQHASQRVGSCACVCVCVWVVMSGRDRQDGPAQLGPGPIRCACVFGRFAGARAFLVCLLVRVRPRLHPCGHSYSKARYACFHDTHSVP